MMVKSKVTKLKNLLTFLNEETYKILDETYQMLTPPGEHYGSIMLSLNVSIKFLSGKKDELNLVVKLLPASPMLRKSFDTQHTFKKEVYAYQNIIPALIKLQHDFKVPQEDILDIFPKCYGARITLDPHKGEVDEDATIIFENLKVQGFVMDDRLIGLDYDTTCLVLRSLAKLHSTSLAYRLLEPVKFRQQVQANITSKVTPKEISKPFSDCIYKHSAGCEDLKDYLNRLQTYVEKSLFRLKNPNPRGENTFTTVVHKDFWVNNVLILRDSTGKPSKSKIVDLQLISYDSPAYDIIHFLFTSVINKVLDEHYYDFIRVYHSEFTRNLEHFKIDLEPYTLNALLNEIEMEAPRAGFDALLILKPIFTERGKVKSSLEDFDENDWKRDDLLGDAYTQKLKDTIFSFAKRNWL